MFTSMMGLETPEERQYRKAQERLDRLKARRSMLDVKIEAAERTLNFYLPWVQIQERLREQGRIK